jgi:hypothetical protein
MAIHKMGLAAYGAYWIIVEKIAAQIRPESISTTIRVPNELWSSWLRTRIDHAMRLLRTLHDERLIICEFADKATSVSVPNILKYGDEYTKRLMPKRIKTPDTLPLQSGLPAVPEQQTYTPEFAQFWKCYPKCIGKRVAFDSFRRVIKTYPATDVIEAATEYSKKCDQDKTEEKFIMHPSTFLNKDRWKDYCFEKEVTA